MLTSKSEFTSKIDWLSVTVPTCEYPPTWSKLKKELTRGMLNYDTGVVYDDGRIELCHSFRHEMKNHIIFDGQTITTLCQAHSMISTDILPVVSSGKPSRLDLAVDIRKGSLPIESLAQSFENGEVETRVIEGLFYRGVGVKGETFYLGSAKADRRLRIYDKAAEQGIKNFEWTRVELQLRHGMAVRSFWRLLKSDNPTATIPMLICDFANFPKIPSWSLAMGTEKIKPCKAPPEQPGREKWLLDTAAKALANEMVRGGKRQALLDEFTQVVLREFDVKQSLYGE